MQSIFTTFAFVVSPVISLRRLPITVVSSMMLLAMTPSSMYRWSLDFLHPLECTLDGAVWRPSCS
jgi:hypothetical protein